MPPAQARRRALIEILKKGHTQSQAELIEALDQAGHPCTQPVVSRDLRGIGAASAIARVLACSPCCSPIF